MKRMFSGTAKAFWRSNNGAILLLLLLIIPVLWWLWCITLDGTDAKYAAIMTKMALNRAVKAAAAAIDTELLAQGSVMIDPVASRSGFDRVFTANLGLREDYSPTGNSFLRQAPEILSYYTCPGPCPYRYSITAANGTEVAYTFSDPGVCALVRISIKHNFSGKVQDIFVFAVAEVLDD